MTADGARGRAIAVLAGAAMFAASPLATGGFGGFDPADFPVPQVDPPMQPAGWAFSVWGLIYLWLLVHAGIGLLRRDVDTGWDRTRWPLIAALVIGAVWIPVAQRDPVLATMLIALMLIGAVWSLMRAPERDRFWCAAPIALFAGWLTAATGVSVGILLAGWGVAAPLAATYGVLVWVLALSAAVLALRPEPAYAAGVAWALIGVAAANGFERPVVSVLALGGAAALVALGVRSSRHG